MRNFFKLAQGVDVVPLSHSLVSRPDLWNNNELRTAHPGTPHSEVDDVWLRFQDTNVESASSVLDENESVMYPAWQELPQAHVLVFDLMRRVEAIRLGRVLITRLRPGAKIEAHVDGGGHAEYYDRYHVVLQGHPGSLFRCGGEQVCMQTGEVWWFDNGVEHEVLNNSHDDRIHMIVDLRLANCQR